MQTNPSSDDNNSKDPDDFNTSPNKNPENIVRGVNDANSGNSGSGSLPVSTPQYGDFGHADSPATVTSQEQSRPAGTNPGGVAAPSTVEPEQRGSTPQNLDPDAVRKVQNDDYETQREGWAKDDPRYGGGTRNWQTNEPANRSTGAESETADSERTNSNDGSNDNPDEFSSLRDDKGQGVPGK